MNILIIGLILVILILLLGCKNNEGFAEQGRNPATGLPTEFGTVNVTSGQPVSLTALTPSNYCADNQTFTTAKSIAFIDDTNNALKIANKKTGADWVNSTWQVIWSSELSDPLWTGTSVTFEAATGSASAKIMIGGQTIGSGGTTSSATPLSVGTSAKLTNSGDLVIVKTDSNNNDVILWSLASHELKSTKTQLNEYLNRGSRIYASTELESLKKKLTNFSKYITDIAPTDIEQIAELKKAHAMIVQARHQMDFDLSELNGVANSKVVSSQNGLNSSLYANLMATTLVAGLFILIATR